MNRVYNFSAGPSALPVKVLEEAQRDMICHGNSGMSVMEMSHRTPEFETTVPVLIRQLSTSARLLFAHF